MQLFDFMADWSSPLGSKYGDKNINTTGQLQITSLYWVVQQGAVLYALTDSNFHEGGTNAKGIKLQAKYTIRKGMQLGYTFFSTKNGRWDINGRKLDVPGKH